MTVADTEDEQWSMLLNDQACFALYAASRALTHLYRPVLEDLGLTYPQYLVLLVLWERGSVPVRELGTALHLDYGTLTPLLKRLEAEGLITRTRSQADERVVQLRLTDKGRELRRQAESIPGCILASSRLTLEKLQRLQQELVELREQLQAP